MLKSDKETLAGAKWEYHWVAGRRSDDPPNMRRIRITLGDGSIWDLPFRVTEGLADSIIKGLHMVSKEEN